ncbi:MAG: methylmalonyl-CoA epimerase [Planctomycetia bacterium]|nr:methylmalonyl-CoA epimerase [Planctomycetia bacterium]
MAPTIIHSPLSTTPPVLGLGGAALPSAEPTPLARLTAAVAIRGLDHLGIAVASLAAARPFYEATLGAVFEGEEVVAEQKVRVAFYQLGTDASAVRLELLEPLDEASPIAKFLAKRGPGLHHTAYLVDDTALALQAAEQAGLRLIDRVPRLGAHGARIGFLHPQGTGGMLIELCSHPTKDKTPQPELE